MNDVKLNGMRELNFNEVEKVSGGHHTDFHRLIQAIFPSRSKPKRSSSSPSVGTPPPAQFSPPPPPQVIRPFSISLRTFSW